MIECLRCWCSTTRKYFDAHDGLCARCLPKQKKNHGVATVYRVEHIGCQRHAGMSGARIRPRHAYHGPQSVRCGGPSPLYGTGGPAPGDEGHNLKPQWICGVTKDQFNDWWSLDHTESEILASVDAADDAGWRVTEYAVPAVDVTELLRQVVFSPGRAEVVRRHLLKDLCCLS